VRNRWLVYRGDQRDPTLARRCLTVLGLACAVVTACTRAVQAWPPPLPNNTAVTIRFDAPRAITYSQGSAQDSVAAVRELRGRVIALHGDTLRVRVSRVATGAGNEAQMRGREASIVLDHSVVVTRRELEGWKFAYLLLGSTVVLYVIAVTLSG
jgi:hypothetical protein